MAICPIIVHFSTYGRALDAWRGIWICVRSKDGLKQLARTSLNIDDQTVPEDWSVSGEVCVLLTPK